MATENINGIYGQQAHTPVPDSKEPDVSKEEVGWYFVERYYNTLSKSPDKLHLFFGKTSQFVAGVEEEKVQVCIGQRSIDERIRELNYQDCKVRITNVDTQASGDNIVVQVIGEMSNHSAPHRKFVQTFVLAPQTNGWYVLNDIFRYILEEIDEVEVAEAAPVETKGAEATAVEAEPEPRVSLPVDIKAVNEELEQVTEEEVKTNGVPEVEAEEPTEPVEEKEFDDSPVVVETPVIEKPTEPAPTPVVERVQATTKAAPTPSPPKPALSKTWAQLAGSRNSTSPAAATAATNAPAKASPTPAAKAAAPAPAAPAPAAQSSTPVRQPSPASSNQEGSTGGWQTADHNRNKSRSGPILDQQGRVRAYVKNVYPHVDERELKERLSKFGELVYFDIARSKNSAFADYSSAEAFHAAVNANPHIIGNEKIYVEERRPAQHPNQRGGNVRGRGNFGGKEGGTGTQRGGFKSGAARGGAPAVANRGRPQAA